MCAESGINQGKVGSKVPIVTVAVIAVAAAVCSAAAFFPAVRGVDCWGWKWKNCGKSRGRYQALWIPLLFVVLFGGCFRMHQVTEDWNRLETRCPEDGEAMEITGRVTDIRETTWSDAVELETEEFGKVLAYWKQADTFSYAEKSYEEKASAEKTYAEVFSVKELRIGQWIRAEGEAGRFETARNPGQFDLKQYYRSQRVSMSLSAEKLEWEEPERVYSPYFDGLYRIRRRCSRILREICQETDSGIFRAAILGEKEGMDAEIRDLYQKNGISHILAISGLHLSMIGMGLYRLLRKAGMRYGSAGCLAGMVIVSYGVMTGGSGSAVRALIMLLASFLASYLGRTYDLLSALSLAALLLAWANPFLISQSGFQLSFGAVLGIGLLGGEWNRIFRPDKNWKKALFTSLSVQLMTGPVVLWHYFQYPVYGVLLNLLVVPLMGYVVLSGLLGIGAGFFHPALGTAAVGSGHYILQWYQMLCKSFARLPGAQAILGRPKWSQIAAYYGILTAMVFGMRWLAENGGGNSGENDRDSGEGDGRDSGKGNGRDNWEGDGRDSGEGNGRGSGESNGRNNSGGNSRARDGDNSSGSRENIRGDGRENNRENNRESNRESNRWGISGWNIEKYDKNIEISGNYNLKYKEKIKLSGNKNAIIRKIKNRATFWLLIAGTAGCSLCLNPLPQSGCDVVFLDVGQGDGIVIQCRGGTVQMRGLEPMMDMENESGAGAAGYIAETQRPGKAVILIDGGSTSEKNLGQKRLEPYLKSCGISEIDIALVSHGDEDHISGLRYLLEECEEIWVRHLVLPELGRADGGYDRLIRAARARGTRIWYMDAGDQILAGGCGLTCLYPQKGEEIDASDRNQQSLIVRADYEKFHMLLTGDADAEGEKRLADRSGGQLAEIQVLKAAHHGSRYSNSEELLDALQPELTVISYKKGNSYGHPHEEAIKRLEQSGCRILETGEQGAVFLHAEGSQLRYWTYLQGD